jgi:hypothetical protein
LCKIRAVFFVPKRTTAPWAAKNGDFGINSCWRACFLPMVLPDQGFFFGVVQALKFPGWTAWQGFFPVGRANKVREDVIFRKILKMSLIIYKCFFEDTFPKFEIWLNAKEAEEKKG